MEQGKKFSRAIRLTIEAAELAGVPWDDIPYLIGARLVDQHQKDNQAGCYPVNNMIWSLVFAGHRYSLFDVEDNPESRQLEKRIALLDRTKSTAEMRRAEWDQLIFPPQSPLTRERDDNMYPEDKEAIIEEHLSSFVDVECATTMLLSEHHDLPEDPTLWSPCSGSARILIETARRLMEMNYKPNLILWDKDHLGLFFGCVSTYLNDIPFRAQSRDALDWDPQVEPLQAHLIVSQPNDSVWPFAQKVIAGLAPQGKAVMFLREGDLSSRGGNSQRSSLLSSDLIHSIVNTNGSQIVMLLSKVKPQQRKGLISLIRPEVDDRIFGLEKALRDPRPMRISRTKKLEDFRFLLVDVSFPMLVEGGRNAIAQHMVPKSESLRYWIENRYGSPSSVSTYTHDDEFIDFSVNRVFRLRITPRPESNHVRLSLLVTAIRNHDGEDNSTKPQIYSVIEDDEVWLTVKRSRMDFNVKISIENSPNEFQVSSEIDPEFLSFYSIIEPLEYTGSMSDSVMQVLDEILIPLPNRERQSHLVQAMHKLNSIKRQHDDDVREIWEGLQISPNTLVRINGYLGATDPKTRLRKWPNPIASAAWMVEIQPTDLTERMWALVRFWEAVAGFHATLLLSALKGIPDLEAPALEAIRSGISKHGNLSLTEASMGAFSLIANTCATKVRGYLKPESGMDSKELKTPDESIEIELLTNQVQAAFGGLAPEFIDRLVTKELAKIFDKVKRLRTSGAHGGAETPKQRQTRADQMYELMGEYDQLTSSVWNQFRLVRGGSSERFDAYFEQKIELMEGNEYPFAEESIKTLDSMKSQTIYMYAPGAEDFMEIKAPLFGFMSIPDETALACFYFNRLTKDGMDLKSFAYGSTGNEEGSLPQISQTVQWLIGLPSNQD